MGLEHSTKLCRFATSRMAKRCIFFNGWAAAFVVCPMLLRNKLLTPTAG